MPPTPATPRCALSSHAPDAVIAHRAGETITAGRFHREAMALAEDLPAGRHLVNTCQDRYLFMVGLGAAMLAGKVTLMPSSFVSRTIEQLQARYPGLACLHDGRERPAALPGRQVPARAAGTLAAADAPLLDAAQVACIVFTSGSTGEPTAHAKTWGRLALNGAAEAERLRAAGLAIVATVPAQHMYGFESSVLLALHGGASLWHGKPFYPADIAAALAALPRPRMLVTTPFHLSTLLGSGLASPGCDAVLCATAPLARELAQRAEALLAAPLSEIYGCTESGQVASRRPVLHTDWQLLPGVAMEVDAQGAWVHGGHVEGRVLLSDHIEATGPDSFRLLGRHADMINIAGKRSSLAHLDAQLKSIPGVLDGCFVQPDEAAGAPQVPRLAALVVAPSLDTAALHEQLRQRIDAVFLPRPLLRVDALPRNATGKLVRAELLAFLASSRRASSADSS